MDPTELARQFAIADIYAGTFKSHRKAANAHGVPRSTLQDRLHGRQSHAVAHQHQQRLTPEQESFLADWILEGNVEAQRPSRKRVREMAILILQMNGDYESLGQLWVSRFVARNPRVAPALGGSAKSSEPATDSQETIQSLLEHSECTPVQVGLNFDDIEYTTIPDAAVTVRSTPVYRPGLECRSLRS